MISLKFRNTEFHPGRNITCRLPKINYTACPGKVIGLTDLEGNVIRYAAVDQVMFIRFIDIDVYEHDLSIEHDPSCRTLGGLYNEMTRCYDDFNAEQIVALIYFTCDEEDV